jgi:hypothetical protein
MRALRLSSTIGSMFIHPDVHLEIARQRHHDLLAAASRRRLANGLRQRRGRAAARSEDFATQRETEIAIHAAITWRGGKC